MNRPTQPPRYNQRIRKMSARSESLVWAWLGFVSLAFVFLSSFAFASDFGDAPRQLGRKIASVTGPGAIALEVTNKSSLDDKSARDVRVALEAELRTEGIRISKPEQAMAAVQVTLSESIREYVWTAEIVVGSDERKVALVSLARPQSGGTLPTSMPVVLRKSVLIAQERPILDAALVDSGGSSRLLVLEESEVAVYHQQSGHWQLESDLPVPHPRAFPRDPRGRLLLRRDHLFDVFLPGTFCRSSASPPLTVACNASDDPWPLTPDDNSVRAFFAPTRNFFTGALSPGIGKISTVPPFYSAAPVARSTYTLWTLVAVDGSIHIVDGFMDQALRGMRWGSDIAAVRSSCGSGTQVIAASGAEGEVDSLRAFEIPDREPVPVSSPLDFEGRIVALWPETSGAAAVAIVKREDTGWYEANRISVSCGN